MGTSRLPWTIGGADYYLDKAITYAQPENLSALLGPLPGRISELKRWPVLEPLLLRTAAQISIVTAGSEGETWRRASANRTSTPRSP